MNKTFFLFLIFFIFASVQGSAVAKALQDLNEDTLFRVTQDAITPNDSGGKWVKTSIILTSYTGWPIHVYGFPVSVNCFANCVTSVQAYPTDSAWKMADSLMLRAQIPNPSLWDRYDTSYSDPWKFKDSLPPVRTKNYQYIDKCLQFTLPAYGSIRIPYEIRAVGPLVFPYQGNQDTIDIDRFGFYDVAGSHFVIGWFSDSLDVTHNIVIRRSTTNSVLPKHPLYAVTPWSAPYVLPLPPVISNQQDPAISGIHEWDYFTDPFTGKEYEVTWAKFQVVGEYHDRISVECDTFFRCGGNQGKFLLHFSGAPKTVIHDTLISTYSNYNRTIVIRTPVEAFSVIKNAYTVNKSTDPVVAPFLGSAEDSIRVCNISEVPIEVQNVNLLNQGMHRNFRITSLPGPIPPHDTGYIIATLFDNDKWMDIDDPRTSATVTATIKPYQTDVKFLDTSISVSLNGIIDVFCPNTAFGHYIYFPPLIQSKIHPRGICFRSTQLSSKCDTGKCFVTYFNNDDRISEYFYPPYYDDPHFTIEVHDFCGGGSVSLPGLVPPDTGNIIPWTHSMQAKTRFTGDDAHNYLTKLHFPRTADTVTIDVLALGGNAPPFDAVNLKTDPGEISIRPNPAYSFLQLCTVEKTMDYLISDALGRILLQGRCSESEVDISTLLPGFYNISFPKAGKTIRFVKL